MLTRDEMKDLTPGDVLLQKYGNNNIKAHEWVVETVYADRIELMSEPENGGAVSITWLHMANAPYYSWYIVKEISEVVIPGAQQAAPDGQQPLLQAGNEAKPAVHPLHHQAGVEPPEVYILVKVELREKENAIETTLIEAYEDLERADMVGSELNEELNKDKEREESWRVYYDVLNVRLHEA